MTPERFRKLKEVLARRQPDLTVLAADVHKPHNISAIIRTCDAVGIHRVHAVSPSGGFHHHRMASGGSRNWVGLTLHPSLDAAVDTLRGSGWRLVAAHPHESARDFREVDYTSKTAVVLGSELEGLDQYAIGAADEAITIPMGGMVESLNVSVAAALILYEAQRQRSDAGMYKASRLDAEEFDRTLFEWAYPEIAERLQHRGQAYPALSEEGELLSNPLRSSS
ncbi:MAG: tRNA (guanosine(18)-2'-O)-methyltransferase TrmH [Gammaproteobacteria bacterium]|nr:tRNA (guanosine(18)-2'-O)-methyltransferase TrmH [Gammaproteobacteria bacterium]MDH3507568.1 tRNA (guanosine(18)-2'-O)-methyltransferase TrmH [Gammaproteobacteria bacterium]